MMSDERTKGLIAQLRCNQVEAFELLVERYGERLYWHIRRIVVRHEEAEDILQDAFLKAYTSFKEFRGESESSLTAWLYRIATNLSIRALHRHKRWALAPLDSVRSELLTTFESEVDSDAEEIVVRLQRAILSLPTKQRLVFNMRYYDELSFEQIAEITGNSLSSLKTNYHYAAKRIKREITTIEI